MTALLVTAHTIASMITGMEELDVEKEEAQELADALIAIPEVSRWVSDKTSGWANLGLVCLKIYGTRFVAIRNNRKRKPVSVIRGEVQQIIPVEQTPAGPPN